MYIHTVRTNSMHKDFEFMWYPPTTRTIQSMYPAHIFAHCKNNTDVSTCDYIVLFFFCFFLCVEQRRRGGAKLRFSFGKFLFPL